MSQPEQRQIEEARALAAKLERLSADSYWAHRASGLRGSLLRWIESENYPTRPDLDGDQAEGQFDRVMAKAFEILVRAAREMR
jgi:hypothetical protein